MKEEERKELFEKLEAQIRANILEILEDVRTTLNDGMVKQGLTADDMCWMIRDAGSNLLVLMRMLDMVSVRTFDCDMNEKVPEERFMVNYATRYTRRSK